MVLTRNLGRLDRGCRFIIGVVCVYLGFASQGVISDTVIAYLVGLFGLINLFAGIAGYCPVYALCGFTTRSHHESAQTTHDPAP